MLKGLRAAETRGGKKKRFSDFHSLHTHTVVQSSHPLTESHQIELHHHNLLYHSSSSHSIQWIFSRFSNLFMLRHPNRHLIRVLNIFSTSSLRHEREPSWELSGFSFIFILSFSLIMLLCWEWCFTPSRVVACCKPSDSSDVCGNLRTLSLNRMMVSLWYACECMHALHCDAKFRVGHLSYLKSNRSCDSLHIHGIMAFLKLNHDLCPSYYWKQHDVLFQLQQC